MYVSFYSRIPPLTVISQYYHVSLLTMKILIVRLLLIIVNWDKLDVSKQNTPATTNQPRHPLNKYSEPNTMSATSTSTIFKLFYTHRRTEQILQAKGVKVRKIERVSINRPSGEFYNCVQVVYSTAAGRCSTFISCREYLTLATQGRRERARDYKAYQDTKRPSQWKVYANVVQLPTEDREPTRGGEGKVRHVITTTSGVTCDCEDYLSQPDYLQEHPYLWWWLCKERHVCKHSINVMSALRFNSLRDYLATWKPEGRLSKLAGVMNRQGGTYYTSHSMTRTA